MWNENEDDLLNNNLNLIAADSQTNSSLATSTDARGLAKLFHAIKVNWWGKCILGKRAMMFFSLNENALNTPLALFLRQAVSTPTQSQQFRGKFRRFASQSRSEKQFISKRFYYVLVLFSGTKFSLTANRLVFEILCNSSSNRCAAFRHIIHQD